MHVMCPFGGVMCAGNQCCPRANETGNKTYPCPTATEGWNGCEGSLPEAVPFGAMFAQRRAKNDTMHVMCPYSAVMCAGNQCCPRANQTGGKTYPCPTATEGWNGCEGSLPTTAPMPALLQRRAKNDTLDVMCPYGGVMCAGNQCCPGANATDGKTYPCPTASASYTTCESGAAKPVTCSAEAEAQAEAVLMPIKLHVQPR